MLRLLAVTMVALYAILLVFGDENRRPEPVARASALEVELIPANYLPSPDALDASIYVSEMSEAEAIQIAMQAGKDLRNSRAVKVLRGGVVQPVVTEAVVTEAAATETVVTQAVVSNAVVETVAAPALWSVTGTRVNLRSGPGTSNGVIGQVTQGTQAEVLADANGWYQIRSTDGATSGWIFGKFLQPG